MKKFRPMLACNEQIDPYALKYPVYAQPKFDGFRCVVLPELGPVTRTLKPIPNRYVREKLSDPKYLHHDGEIVTLDEDGKIESLEVIQSKLNSFSGEPNFEFHTFDHVEFPTRAYHARQSKIAAGLPVDTFEINSVQELLMYENMMVEAGWEGVIIRSPHAPYKFGRSTLREQYLLKMKRFHDDEAEVIGCVELIVNTNEKTRDERGYAKRSSAKAGLVPGNTLGALTVRWRKTDTVFEIGSGFTDAQRRRYWQGRDDLIGEKVTFKYQRIGPKGAPLLPIFKAFRSDEDIV